MFIFYLLRGVGSLSSENDMWTALGDISSDLDPFIQEYHQIHWEDERPPCHLFSFSNRVCSGFTAQNF